MSIDFSTRAPWSGITNVTWDSQAMVKIPKFYIKCHTPSTGAFAGKQCWEIADLPQDGFHVHPAFVKNNAETDYFLIGAYEASADGSKACSLAGKAPWVNITYDNSRNACTARNTGAAGSQQYGWHMQNIWERQAFSLLCMIEAGTPNVQPIFGQGNVSSSAAVSTGASNAVWRGIHEPWGNVWEWVDGFRGGNTTTNIRIFDNTGTDTYVETSVACPATDGWVKTMYTTTGSTYNLGDGMFPASIDDTEANGVLGDYYWSHMPSGRAGKDYCARAGGRWDDGSHAGLFYFSLNYSSSYATTHFGFRLACNPF